MQRSLWLRAAVVPLALLLAVCLPVLGRGWPYAMAGSLVFFFIAAAGLASISRGALQNLFLIVASLSVGSAVLEGIFQARKPRISENMKGMWEADARLGHHAKKPGVAPAEKLVDGKLSYRVSYTFDDALRRQTLSSADGPKVRFFGDSYTFGEGLNDGDTLPQQFANLSGANVLNFGYPGYSPAQALRAVQLGLYDKELSSAKLIVLQTAPFHVPRTSCKYEFTRGLPHFVTIKGKLQLTTPCAPPRKYTPEVYSHLLDEEIERVDHADVQNYLNIVDAFIELVREKYNAPVLVLDMLHGSDDLKGTGFTSKETEANFREAGAFVIDDTLPLTTAEREIPYDGHPSAMANQLMARKVVLQLQKALPDALGTQARKAAPMALVKKSPSQK